MSRVCLPIPYCPRANCTLESCSASMTTDCRFRCRPTLMPGMGPRRGVTCAIKRSLQTKSSTTSPTLAAADACTSISPVTWPGSVSARGGWLRWPNRDDLRNSHESHRALPVCLPTGLHRNRRHTCIGTRRKCSLCGNQLYGRAKTRHFLTASRLSPHTSRARLSRSQWMVTVVCETPVSHGRESGKAQPSEAPAMPRP